MKQSHIVMKQFIAPLVFLIAVMLLLIFMISTKPSGSNFIFSAVPLVMVWIISYSALVSVFEFIKNAARKSSLKRFAAIVSTLVMFLLMFSALGSVSLFDILLLGSLAAVTTFYLQRTWSN